MLANAMPMRNSKAKVWACKAKVKGMELWHLRTKDKNNTTD